jgi:copper chaperone
VSTAARLVLTIAGMHCASCGMLIDEALEDLPGVLRSATNLRKNQCEVSYEGDPSTLSQITEEITALGYTVVASTRPG